MRKTTHGRVYRSAAEWRTIFERFGRSGLEPEAFCQREGIVLSSFRKWSRQVQLEGGEGTGFVELVPGPAQAARWEVELALPNGAVLRVRG